MIDFSRHIRRFEKLDGRHWLEIRRRVDGGEVSVYDHPVRCWISPRSKDSPDPQPVMGQPVISSLEIYTSPEIDVRNRDFLIVQKTNPQGQAFGSWRGICGEPFKYGPFQTVNMQMTALGSDAPRPAPPPGSNTSVIYVHFLNHENKLIRDSKIHRMERGEQARIPHLSIDGYEISHAKKDGKKVNLDELNFVASASVYNVNFYYAGAKLPVAIKPLVDSAFTRPDGSSANGLHLYGGLDICNVREADGLLEVEVKDGLTFEHSFIFRLLTLSTIMNSSSINTVVTYPMMGWHRIAEVDGNVLRLMPYTPSEEERAACVVP